MTAIEHMPPCIIMHRFCIIMAVAWSSHVHVHDIPPCIFSIFIVQRGTIIMEGIDWPMPMFIPIPMPLIIPGIIMPAGIIIMDPISLDIACPIIIPRPVEVAVISKLLYLMGRVNRLGLLISHSCEGRSLEPP